jgi:hypothetical protein
MPLDYTFLYDETSDRSEGGPRWVHMVTARYRYLHPVL